MTIWLISYTARGRALAARVGDILRAEGHSCRTFALPKFVEEGDEPLALSAADWAGKGFAEADALLFCCASGIAVRAIAPHVKDKRTDPAVLVLDEGGTFVIPLSLDAGCQRHRRNRARPERQRHRRRLHRTRAAGILG